jgi:regulator of Ty1 transposition protein 103
MSCLTFQVLVEALAVAYKSASLEIQQKLRRTADVWREREIFETPVLDEIEVALNGM